MIVYLPAEQLAALAQRWSGVLTRVGLRHAHVWSAEDRVADLERTLTSNRQIGMAVGILMCRHQLTTDQAFAMLRTHSQHRNIKVRDLARTVISTGGL